MNEPEIKMLSLWQPWASLCIWRNPDGNAEKRVETRHWQTPYRGLLAIHATASWNADADFAYTTTPIFRETLMRHGVQSPKHELIFGAILGVVELYDIKPTGTILDYAIREQYFGDYDEGRFGWLLRNPIEFDEPIYCRGLQSLGAPKPEIKQQILERLKFKGETMTTKKSKLALVEDLPAKTTDQRHERPFTEDEVTVAFQYRKNGWIIWKDENFRFGCEKQMPDGTIKCVVEKDTIDEVTDWIDLIEPVKDATDSIQNVMETNDNGFTPHDPETRQILDEAIDRNMFTEPTADQPSVDDAFASELADLYAEPEQADIPEEGNPGEITEVSPEDEAIQFFTAIGWVIGYSDESFYSASKAFPAEAASVTFAGYVRLDELCHDMVNTETSRENDHDTAGLKIWAVREPDEQSEPEPKPDRPNIIRKNLRVQLTAHEVAIKNTSYHETIDEIDGEKNLLIATKRKAEAKIKELEARASELRQAAISGYEHRDVMCKEIFDWDSGTVEVYRLDTDTLVDARPISERERQQKFSF